MNNLIGKFAQISATAKVIHSVMGIYSRVKDYAELRDSTLDDYSYIAQQSIVNKTIVKKFTSIGSGCYIGLWEHDTEVSTHSFYLYEHSGNFVEGYTNYDKDSVITHIGNDVWIGANVVILKGIVIGDGAIIGAGSVVTRNIPSYAIAVGNPTRIVRYRYSPEEIEWFEKLQWWDFDREKLQSIVDKGGFKDLKYFKQLLNYQESK